MSDGGMAQNAGIINDSVYSGVLKENRRLMIGLPEEYKPGSGVKYDVVYILDGETHFSDFLYIYKFARKENFIPPLILVGLPNTFSTNGSNMRNRDFTPGRTDDIADSGGADNFIAFLENELIPYIGKKYPASGVNSLFGHSLGGLFTMYVFLKQPGLFTDYYCSDPAFPWNNYRMIEMAKETLKNWAEHDRTLWIDGTEATYRNVGIAKMDSVVREWAPKGFRWRTSVYPDETHMSVRLKGIYDGLKYTFDGYDSKKQVEFHPMGGSLLWGKPVHVFLNGSFPEVHYTTDGSEPDVYSEQAPQLIEITAPARVTVKWIGENKKYITSVTGNFELSEVWQSLKSVRNIMPGGMRYSYYEGKWDSLPDFNKLNPVKTGIADSSFSLDKLPARSNFGCVFEGYFKADLGGYYIFAISSGDGSKLSVNGHEIIDNDGLHGNDYYRSYVVPLQEGYYPLRLEYFLREGHPHLDLIYLSPKNNETVNLSFKMMYLDSAPEVSKIAIPAR